MAALHKTSFDSLTEAIAYRTQCPCCNTPLQMSKDVEDTNIRSLDFGDQYLCAQAKNSTVMFLIDIVKEDVKVIHPSFNDNSMGLYNSGILYCSFMKTCNKCEQYYFRLNIELDLTNKIVLSRVVNSEFIAFEANNLFYELKNNYVRKETEYRDDKMPSPIMLPLITIDFDNPTHAVTRINKIKSLI